MLSRALHHPPPACYCVRAFFSSTPQPLAGGGVAGAVHAAASHGGSGRPASAAAHTAAVDAAAGPALFPVELGDVERRPPGVDHTDRPPAARAAARAGALRAQVVPAAPPPSAEQLQQLHELVTHRQRLVVLTGAGVSTESGIPDYRSPQGAYSTGFKPMTHQEFVRSEGSRRRYWVRSYIGWRRFISAAPGTAHQILARLEGRGRLAGGMITQNVDRLHHRAGSSPLELHGTTHLVVCLACNHLTDRHAFQREIQDLNPEWAEAVVALERGGPGSEAGFGMRQRPDGDVEVSEEFWRRADLHLPACRACGGVLKPHVVFFGDNVPRERAEAAAAMVQAGDALLVVGSSLMTLSAFRLARAASDAGKPLAILNIGPTRADPLASLKIEARCGEALSRLVATGSLDVPLT